jgi:hypothetical protein
LVETLINEFNLYSPAQKDSQKFVEFPMWYHYAFKKHSQIPMEKQCQIFDLVVI